MKKFNLKNMICSILFFSLSFLQLSCISGGVGGATLSNSTQLVRIGEVTEIPLLATTKSTIVVPITNNSNDNVVLQSTRVQVNGVITTKFDQDNLIDISKCQSIIARSSCDMVVTPPQISGSFVINMTYVNSNGFQYKTSQFIRYSSNVAATNGFVYFNPEVMPKSDGVNTLSIPTILTQNYSTLSIKSNQLQADQVSRLICPSNNYSLGTMCTVIVEYTNKFSLSNIENNSQVIISGDIKNSKRKNFTPITLSLTITNAGNIITSAVNTIINPTNSSMPTITLFNNGTSTVSNISIYGITPITIDQIGGCGTTLEVESSCTFTLSASSATANGASQVLISYINGLNQIKNLSFNVLYTTQVPSPHLYVASNGWLMNTTVNTVNYQGVYVANKGNVTLNNLQFGNISNISGMNYGGNGQTCVNGMSLAPESSCIMVVNYAPTAVVAVGNSINVVINASYYSQTNSVLSYISSVNIKYSANAASSGTFVAAGDYGAITSSVTTPAGAWTVQNNTPFTAAATTIERMVNNDTLQVIGTGGTAAGAGFIYQGEKGMIWQSASGGTNAPPTGATNRKITGLTYDSTNGYIVSNDQGAGDLYSITNITGVTPTWNTVLSGAFANQPFNLFNFGQSLAYLAPENTATAGQELDVATTNPTTTIWTAVNPTGAARAYKGAIYDGGRYCAFAANRFVSCATSAGFTTGSAWTQNGTAIYTSGTLNMVTNNGSNTYIAALSASPFVVYISSPFTPESSITWTTAGTAPSAALIWVTFGGGKYIGVSAASPGLVWTSPDGNTWTQQTLGTANNPINAPYGFVYYDGTSYWA